MELDKAFIDLLKDPIVSRWTRIGEEVEQVCRLAGAPLENVCAIGFCLDINAAEATEASMSVLNAAIAEHSYDAVLSYLARHIRLA